MYNDLKKKRKKKRKKEEEKTRLVFFYRGEVKIKHGEEYSKSVLL